MKLWGLGRAGDGGIEGGHGRGVGGLGLRGWKGLGLYCQEVGVRRELDDGDAALGDLEEGLLFEGMAVFEIGQGSEGGEGVANAQEEVAVADSQR